MSRNRNDADTPGQLLPAVREILQFYRRFHSYRYVQDKLVLRRKTPLPDAAVSHIQGEFTDILDSGTIETTAALKEERDDVPDLPRLILHFNRWSHGRLRQMIDYINTADQPATVNR